MKTQSPEILLQLALQSGVEHAEVFQSYSLSHPVFFEANRLKQLETAQVEGIALRLWHNGSPGLAVAYGLFEPEILVEKALALSQLNQPENIELSTGSPITYPDLGSPVSVEQLVSWGEETIDLIRQSYPETLCSSEWDCEVETTRLINSLGLDSRHTDTTLGGYISAEWIRGDDFLNIGDGETKRDTLKPKIIAQRILQRLEWAQENVSPPPGKCPILLTSKAAELLWSTVSAALNGKQVLEGASPWSHRLGELITSPLLTLSQEPEIGPYSCPFDDEGTLTRPIIFIQNGVLQLFYTDHKTGRDLGSGTTGNGFRPGLGSYPTPGLFNLLIQPGQLSLSELINTLDDGLIVDQILGSGAGISGDFSINVDLGYRVKNGKIIGRVKDTMVTGNVYQAVKNIVELGQDADWIGSCYTPSVIVEGLSITGKS